MSFIVVIPARYASTRFPGKPLALLAGKPVLQHVYENACASAAQKVIIATDDIRIQEEACVFGAEVVMTSQNHTSGTERLAEVARKLGFKSDTLIINLQGDEPMLPSLLINQVADALNGNPAASVSTLCQPITELNSLLDPNIVKVVFGNDKTAQYFSRAPIPWQVGNFAVDPKSFPENCRYYRHLGIYAYRPRYLKTFVGLERCPWELAESLEQLRTLYYGGVISIDIALTSSGPGIDTPEDLAFAEALFEKNKDPIKN